MSSSNRQVELVSGIGSINISSGVSQQRDGLIYGNGKLNAAGPGTLILTASNTYSGGTTVSAGTLQVNNTSGSGTGTGAVTVTNDGTLGGTGSGIISGTVEIENTGELVGYSSNTLTVGGLTLDSGANEYLPLGCANGYTFSHDLWDRCIYSSRSVNGSNH